MDHKLRTAVLEKLSHGWTRKHTAKMFIAVLFVKAKAQKQPMFLLGREWTNCWYMHSVVYHKVANEYTEALWISLDAFQCVNLYFTRSRVWNKSFHAKVFLGGDPRNQKWWARRKGRKTDKMCTIKLLMTVGLCAHSHWELSENCVEYSLELFLWRCEARAFFPHWFTWPQVDPLGH